MTSGPLVERAALFCLHTSPLAALGGPNAGGMNLHVLKLADGLSKLGIQADVFTRRHSGQVPQVIRRASGARIIHVSGGPARDVNKRLLPLHIPAMVKSIRAFMEQDGALYDVFHSHYWLSGLVAMRLRDDARVPVLHMFHTLAGVKERYLGMADDSDSVLRMDGEKCLITSVDAVVGATPGELQLMEDIYGRRPARFEVIPSGVDLSVFRPLGKEESRHRLDLTADRVVLFAGRMDKIKGLDVVLRSVARFRQRHDLNVKLVVLGGYASPSARGMNGYRRLARDLGLHNSVEFRGIVPQEEMATYYSAADICAIPSAYESFGLTAIESMACQTPPVAFEVGGLAETICDGRTGFLSPAGDEDSYADALERALLHDRRDLIGRQARFAVQRYEWNRIVEQTADLYDASVELRSASVRTGRECWSLSG